MRTKKVASVAEFIPSQVIDQGTARGLAIVAWGSTYGAIYQAVKDSLREGYEVAHIHLTHLNPFPKNLGQLLNQFDNVLVPELNTGQLATLLRDRLLVDVIQLNKVTGQPLTVGELRVKITELAHRQLKKVTGN
ncbi:MAG: 2-oxoglutarate ferredoxin oxidoreductase subunit alpha, partial [Gammaproteobacteria bacterium]|nr:2-oxoglutarate ferredoxin oxidoreductase subunit alpha [Gammaproteobacteria bacterium]